MCKHFSPLCIPCAEGGFFYARIPAVEKLLFSDEFNDSVPAEDKAEAEEETEPEVEVEISLQPADQEEKPVEAEAEEVSAEDAPAQEKTED